MPHKDPEARRKSRAESARRTRAAKKGEVPPSPPPQAVTSLGAALSPESTGNGPVVTGPFVSAKDLDLSDLAAQIRAETGNLSTDGWLKLQGALGLEIMAIVRESLRNSLIIRSVKDVVALLKLGRSLIDPVIAAKGNLGGDDAIPSDLQQAHADMLSDPLGLEMAQRQMQLLSQIMLSRGN